MTSSKPFSVEPLDATFGAVITGLKLTDLGEHEFAALYDEWLQYALLIFPAQNRDWDSGSKLDPLDAQNVADLHVSRQKGRARLLLRLFFHRSSILLNKIYP